MSLAQILFPSPVPQGMEEWLHAHVRHHEALNYAVEARFGIKLPARQLFPINTDDPASVQIFLSENQLAHNELGSLLGIQGNDLANVNFTDEDQRKAWMFIHFTAHRSAAESLGLGI